MEPTLRLPKLSSKEGRNIGMSESPFSAPACTLGRLGDSRRGQHPVRARCNIPTPAKVIIEGGKKVKKSVMYSVRLTPLEYEALKSKCEKSGVEVSEFVRSAMKGKNVSVIEGIPEMIVALNRIGNNINQIGKEKMYPS